MIAMPEKSSKCREKQVKCRENVEKKVSLQILYMANVLIISVNVEM